MAIIGVRQSIDLMVPTGIDAGQLFAWQMENGSNPMEVLAEAAAAIGAVNEELAARWAGVSYITESMYSVDRVGDGTRRPTPKRAEFVPARVIRGDTIGHMLPREDFGEALGWTSLYLRRANLEQLRADVMTLADNWRDRFDLDMMTRMLTNTENVIASVGYDVPWAIGTGTNVNFIPPPYGQFTHTSSHTHFQYKNSSTQTWADLLNAMALELVHHGHFAPLTCIVSLTDIATIKAITGFINFVAPNAQPVGVVTSSTPTAPVQMTPGLNPGVPGELFGWFNSDYGLVEMRWHVRVPTEYSFMTKSYGPNNPKNGINIRTEPGIGFGLQGDPQKTNSLIPKLERIDFYATHGVGVGDRTNGVVGYIHTGISAFANPTIT